MKSFTQTVASQHPILLTLIGILVPILFMTGCAGATQLLYESTSAPVHVDGNLEEWEGSLKAVESGKLSIGIRKHDQFFYIAVETTDANLMRQIMASGLTVWFNPTADKTKHLGIRFPIGMMTSVGARREPGQARQPGVPGAGGTLFSELEIVNESGEARRVPVDGVAGIAVRARAELGAFRYELQIPIASSESFDYGLDISTMGTFGLGLETGAIGPAAGGAGGGAAVAGRGGGRGGRGGGRGGRRGGRGGGSRGGGQRGGGGGAGSGGFEPLQFWSVVSVAETP